MRVKPGTLNTRPQSSSFVFGEKPTLVTPPVGLHYHGRWKCIGGRGRGCIAITATVLFHSQPHEKFVVLVSDEEIQEIFTEAVRLMDSVTTRAAPQVYQVKDYRGCEHSHVICVGVEDSWMVEGISRAVQTLFIVDGGTSAAARSRMGLWMEMERRGLLLHRPLPSTNALASLSDNDWKALDQISQFLMIPKEGGMDEDGMRENSPPKGATRIFAMGSVEDGRVGIWEVYRKTLWVQDAHSARDTFLAHSGMLIHGTGGEVQILHLEGKDWREAPHGWDYKLPIPQPFFVEGTMGVGMWDSFFLAGGKRNPRSGLRLALHSNQWVELPNMMTGRWEASTVMLDPHTILVLGGMDLEKGITHSSCEFLDLRTEQWSPFPLNIPIPVSNHATTLYGDHVYISGGIDGRESRGTVWRCRVSGEGPVDTLSSLQFSRHDHGMMGDGVGGLKVIGGRHVRVGEEIVDVLLTETLTLDGRREWKHKPKLPFVSLWKASLMNLIS
ncbi:unnamed protein product [Darwinula stevensoni]|uniref:Uncharacterized protein n=1 Tax=Darwinula stevensoni TaxID=69355 RepID=A0A7R9AF81_9CRUS|nr:unnamed protein product [Darwinula stevensoni]CAG0903037.1 unnamed protein product [Darwinula stevensoni]